MKIIRKILAGIGSFPLFVVGAFTIILACNMFFNVENTLAAIGERSFVTVIAVTLCIGAFTNFAFGVAKRSVAALVVGAVIVLVSVSLQFFTQQVALLLEQVPMVARLAAIGSLLALSAATELFLGVRLANYALKEKPETAEATA